MSYKLVWQDDFNIDGPVDETIWNIEHAGHGFGNREFQYYTPRSKNLFCKDSILHIVAHKENYEHRHYTSAKITTYGKKSIGYGMVEVRAKLPKGKGTWPAIWMLAESIRHGKSWPLCGEIDIMENIGRSHEEIHFSLHSKLYNHVNKTQQTYFEIIPRVTDGFHTYKMIWEPDYIKFLVDDKEYVTFNRGEDNRDVSELGWPFIPPYFLILNLAIGGNWGGEVDDSIFPCEFLIDFVRVYERI